MAVYIIEHGTDNNRWLSKIEHRHAGDWREQINSYRPQVEEAVVFEKRAAAVEFAKKWRARVWRVKDGRPDKMIWPEEMPSR